MTGGAPDVAPQASYTPPMPGPVPGVSQPSTAAPYYPPPAAPGQYPQQPYYPPQGQGPVPGLAVHPQGSYVPAPPGTMMMMVPVPAQPQALPHYWPNQSISVWCAQCQSQVDTRIMFNPGLGTWLIAGGICLAGGILGCCMIPFCVDGLKDCTHSCPKCNRFLGQHKMV
ncbi:hypothetical protein HYH02_005041 [Chlamydomonas schloesseri]|uniref:LITAF domain-containing protein n=1 Tax=Chlamydomonas schloesseri TaxID=2026947 RepID=A0A835WPW5_9CHLO|nr:hypothetical protein HYH02_005041 [Chlamydomonas schloesseri]|eukprot:KAG2450540.1 hypothetical protein HYH02_005041 [Chlamydomonas schloesseri]